MKLMDEVKLQSSVDALSELCFAFKDDPRWPEIRQNLLAIREVLRDGTDGVEVPRQPLNLADAEAIAARYGAGVHYETRSGNYRTGAHHVEPTKVCFTLPQLAALLADRNAGVRVAPSPSAESVTARAERTVPPIKNGGA